MKRSTKSRHMSKGAARACETMPSDGRSPNSFRYPGKIRRIAIWPPSNGLGWKAITPPMKRRSGLADIAALAREMPGCLRSYGPSGGAHLPLYRPPVRQQLADVAAIMPRSSRDPYRQARGRSAAPCRSMPRNRENLRRCQKISLCWVTFLPFPADTKSGEQPDASKPVDDIAGAGRAGGGKR